MRVRSLGHLPDHVLVAELASLVRRDRALTCELLLHLGEVDARRLYLPAAYPSMHAYCVGELGLSEAAALKRIRVARLTRDYPAILEALSHGKLHMSAVVQLSSSFRPDNVDALIAAAAGRSKAELEILLAERTTRLDAPTVPTSGTNESSVDVGAVGLLVAPSSEVRAESGRLSPGRVEPGTPPVSPRRIAFHASIDEETHELLRYAQTLLGHAVPSGDVSEVLRRAAAALVEQLEKRRFAKASRHRPRRRGEPGPGARHIPAAVRGEVWERDGGRCTFSSEQGRRCDSDVRLEFDHIVPVARGGASTAANLRLLCRAHNQHAADRVYGEGFMRGKREARRNSRERAATWREPVAADRQPARRATVAADAAAPSATIDSAAPGAMGAGKAESESVVPWLRALGFRAEEARRGAEAAAPLGDAPLEDRVKLALSVLARARPQRRPLVAT